jgi:hypothetical protein
MNANAYIFGPLLWASLNDAAVISDARADVRQHFLRLLSCLAVSIPCGACRHNYQEHTKNNKPDSYVNDGKALEYLWWLHDQVNQRLGRVSAHTEISFDKVVQPRSFAWSGFGSVNMTFDICSIIALVGGGIEPHHQPSESKSLAAILETIQLLLWFAGINPVHNAPEMATVALTPFNGPWTTDALFEYVCAIRKSRLPTDSLLPQIWRDQYNYALL